MKQIVCDKCGAARDFPAPQPNGYSSVRVETPNRTPDNADLCPPCTHKLRHWLREAPPRSA